MDALPGNSHLTPEQAVYFFSWFYFQAPSHAASSHCEHKAFLQENEIKLILPLCCTILCYFYLQLRKHDVSWKSKYILKGQTNMKCETRFKAPKYGYECMWCLSLKVNTGNKVYREIQPALHSSQWASWTVLLPPLTLMATRHPANMQMSKCKHLNLRFNLVQGQKNSVTSKVKIQMQILAVNSLCLLIHCNSFICIQLQLDATLWKIIKLFEKKCQHRNSRSNMQ